MDGDFREIGEITKQCSIVCERRRSDGKKKKKKQEKRGRAGNAVLGRRSRLVSLINID